MTRSGTEAQASGISAPTQDGEWEAARLGEVAACRGGYGFPPADQGHLAGEIPFFKVSDMNISGNRRAMRTANNYVDQGVLSRLKAKPFPAGTVIFPKIGAAIATNKKRLLIKPSLVDNNVMGVWPTDLERLTSDFLYYWLLSVDLRTLSAIGPLPSIAQHAVQNALISLPSLDEQRAISKVLTAVEGAREAIENVIAATRELKRSFVRHLFTYGPVPIDHAEEVPLKDTEVGSIPEHWRVATIRRRVGL